MDVLSAARVVPLPEKLQRHHSLRLCPVKIVTCAAAVYSILKAISSVMLRHLARIEALPEDTCLQYVSSV